MARFDNNALSGAIGNIIFYTVNGVTYARSKPGKQNKRKKPKEDPAKTLFGIVSSFTSAMLLNSKTICRFEFSRKMHNKVRGWLLKQIRLHETDTDWNINSSETPVCTLNEESDLRNMVWIQPEVLITDSKTVSIHFPAFIPTKKIIAPGNCVQVEIMVQLITACTDLAPWAITANPISYQFNYTSKEIPAQTFTINTGNISNNIAVIIMSVNYWLKEKAIATNIPTNQTDWMPAAIIGIGRV